MIIYKRNIDKKLLSLRILFFVLLASCFCSFYLQYTNFGYFIIVAFITISFVVVKNFIVCEDSFQVLKYYFFGLIKLKWQFNKNDNINVTSSYSEFGQDDDMPNIDDSTGTGLGCLFTILYTFKPSKITNSQFNFELLDETYTHLKSVNIALNNNEFNYVKDFYLK